MAVDWIFEPDRADNAFRDLAEQAGRALGRAREALERSDEDALSADDRRALSEALSAVVEARGRLRTLDGDLLQDAQRTLEAAIDRSRPQVAVPLARRTG